MATVPFHIHDTVPPRTEAPPSRPHLSGRDLAAFASVTVPITAAGLPLAVYLPAIYAEHYGLSLTAMGLVFLLCRFWDAIADPFIGILSDRTTGRFGRRKPWITAGGLIFGLASAVLFFPPVPVTIAFLGITLFVFYLGWTMVQIPFLAWSGELSKHYHERTRVATYVQVVTAIALLATLVLPTIADQVKPGDADLKLSLMGGFVLISLIPALFFTLRSFPDPQVRQPDTAPLSISATVRIIASEPLLVRVLASDFAVTLAQNIRGALFVFFVAYYMGLPQWSSALFLLQFIFGIFAGPVWMRIGYRFGKHRAAVAGELVQVAINLGLLFVTPSTFPLLISLTIAQGLTQGSGNLMLRAIVADIADKHQLGTGADRTGLFFSVFSLSGKAATAVAVGIALPLVAWFGFDPKAATNSDTALTGLLLVFALGPAIAHIFSALLIRAFPLDEAAHIEIRRRLDEGNLPLSPAE